jgi:hypothetical protein
MQAGARQNLDSSKKPPGAQADTGGTFKGRRKEVGIRKREYKPPHARG